MALGRSASVTRMSEFEHRPNPSLYRCSSLLSCNDYYRAEDRFTPAASSFVHNEGHTPLWSSRYHRPSYIMDSYWFDKQYYFSPLYKGTQPYKRHYASHNITYPCSWNYPYIYWSRYKGYWYDSDNDYAPLYRRYFDPYCNDSAHRQRFWHRYRSHLTNDNADRTDGIWWSP